MSATTLFQIPENVVSIADFLFTDPTTGQSSLPWLREARDYIAGADIDRYEPISVNYGNGQFNIRRYDPQLRTANVLYGADQASLPFLSWWGDEDPRADLAAAAAPYAGLNLTNLEAEQGLPNIISGIIGRAAFQNRLGGLGVPEDQLNGVLDTLFPMQTWQNTGGLSLPSTNLFTGGYNYHEDRQGSDINRPTYGIQADNPYYPLIDTVMDSLSAPGIQPYNYGQVSVTPIGDARRWDLTGSPYTVAPTDFNSDISTGALRQALAASGLTYTQPNPIGTTVTGGTAMSSSNNGQGVQPTPLNMLSPFMELLAGGYRGFNDAGDPIFTQLTDDQWQALYGTNTLFGPQQRDDIRDLLNPLPLSQQEQLARDIMSTDPAVRQAALQQAPQLAAAMNVLNHNVIPGLQNLANTGYRTETPDLYTQGQYQLAEQLARTGNRQGLEDAASTWMNQRVAPQLAARFAGQLGTSGSDFGGELLNQANLFSADIADRVSQNQITGQGIWGDMTSSQGLLDAQLSEAAAARRANALPLLGTWASYANQLPLAYAQDLSNFGGANRQTDELLRPGRTALSLYQQLLTGANPNNLGYVAQGQLPSSNASYLNGLAGQSAAFSGSSLAGLLPSLTQGLGQAGGSLLGNIFSGGGLDGNGNMGLLGDLGGFLGNVGGSLLSGIGSLFGGGGGSVFGGGSSGYGNSTGGSYYDYTGYA